MCIALPGKVLEASGKKALVEIAGKRAQAESHFLRVRPGDWVLVFGSNIVEKTTERRAGEIARTLGLK